MITLEDLLNAIREPDDFLDIEVYRLLVLFLETLSESDDIPNQLVRYLRLYRTRVVQMINTEVNSIEIADLLRADKGTY